MQCKALEQRHGVKTVNTSVINNHNIADAVSTLYEKISEEQKQKYLAASTLSLMKKQTNTAKCQCWEIVLIWWVYLFLYGVIPLYFIMISIQYVWLDLQTPAESMYFYVYPEGRDKICKLFIYWLKFIDASVSIYKEYPTYRLERIASNHPSTQLIFKKQGSLWDLASLWSSTNKLSIWLTRKAKINLEDSSISFFMPSSASIGPLTTFPS